MSNPNIVDQPTTLQSLRLVMVNRSLWMIVVLAGLVQIVVNIEEFRRGRFHIIALYLALYSLVLIAATRKSLPYTLRALATPVVLYLVAVLELWLYTIVSNAAMYLFSFVLLTGIFIGFRAGITALLISVVTIVIAGWAYITGRIPEQPIPDHLLLTRPEMALDIVN